MSDIYFIEVLTQNIFPVAWLGEMKYVPFENTELPVPENVEDYLETRFGEGYMENPPVQKRKVSSHVVDYKLVVEESVIKDSKI